MFNKKVEKLMVDRKKTLEEIGGSANQHRVRICKIIKMKNVNINKNKHTQLG